jgi:formate dehydrogenase maturation protein FdhE
MSEVRQVCPCCADEILVPDGVDYGDARWLHEQRCIGLYPEMRVLCGACDEALDVDAGLSAGEILWMHAGDCSAAAPELEL